MKIPAMISAASNSNGKSIFIRLLPPSTAAPAVLDAAPTVEEATLLTVSVALPNRFPKPSCCPKPPGRAAATCFFCPPNKPFSPTASKALDLMCLPITPMMTGAAIINSFPIIPLSSPNALAIVPIIDDCCFCPPMIPSSNPPPCFINSSSFPPPSKSPSLSKIPSSCLLTISNTSRAP